MYMYMYIYICIQTREAKRSQASLPFLKKAAVAICLSGKCCISLLLILSMYVQYTVLYIMYTHTNTIHFLYTGTPATNRPVELYTQLVRTNSYTLTTHYHNIHILTPYTLLTSHTPHSYM